MPHQRRCHRLQGSKADRQSPAAIEPGLQRELSKSPGMGVVSNNSFDCVLITLNCLQVRTLASTDVQPPPGTPLVPLNAAKDIVRMIERMMNKKQLPHMSASQRLIVWPSG